MNKINLLLKYRRIFIILFHIVLFTFAYLLGFFLRFDFSLSKEYLDIYFRTLPLLILVKFCVFYYFGVFSGLWRYVSMSDLWQILKANSFAAVIFIAAEIFIHGLNNYPRSLFILDFLICTVLVSGIRFFVRFFKEKYRINPPKRQKKVLIIGAGDAGIFILKEFQNNPDMGELVGLIDDDIRKQNATVYGVKILGGRKDISKIVDKFGVEEIILAIPSAKGEVIREILSYCQMLDVKIKIIPKLGKIFNGDFEIKPRQVKPDDLLGRETVDINEDDVGNYIKHRRIMVTGAAGSIGSELCRQIAGFEPAFLILYDYNENDSYFLQVEFRTKYPNIEIKTIVGDIKDIRLLKHTFSNYKPEVVFHAAAHKHVPLMEDSPAAAVKNNVVGSRNLIYAAAHYKVKKFILISTDKAVNPTSVMGATKRIAEMILQGKSKNSYTKFMAVRFGNVIGSAGSIVPLFKKQIEDGGPVTITHPEVKRYFMSVGEAVKLVLQAGALGKGGEIFVLDMGEQIKIIDIAKNLIVLSGLKPEKDIQITFTGLRPGEKLYEEILHDTERDSTTKHDKIFITQPNNFDPRKLRRTVKELEQLVNLMSEEEIVRKLKEMVPVYLPSGNSGQT